jgi:gas vesicle protein
MRKGIGHADRQPSNHLAVEGAGRDGSAFRMPLGRIRREGTNMKDMKEKVMWLVIGAAVGAGIALLYAPKTGRETRRLIRRKAEDARDTLVETGENIRDTLAETGGTILDAGKDVYKKGVGVAAGAADLFERGRRMVRS